ncbi:MULTISPECIES: ATP-binding cassette domain-containing protein [unclassified Roseivirga]|uniref:ABC transporter ATP-binding protein n=1 Tax=unclassified Roseivirga TaxID=2626142 RepID=UPI00257F7CC9|nr:MULTISPECIES: ATP-binding cassette domain-containing protein [unclassified Roseivirga]|tara:strand:+ start:26121 stop:26738 length:618 start_codon:yes stop_codon:yes gene_type:complete
MQIAVEGLGKKFNREWIFRNLSIAFEKGKPCAITGGNGSGKSTFLQVLCGYIPASEGKVTYTFNNKPVPTELVYQHFDISTPYLELIEEFTLREFLTFHFKFKKLKVGLTINDFVELVYLQNSAEKPIRNFSSGMKQRLKLGLCFYSQSEICLLDEPTTNLDTAGIAWYRKSVEAILEDKLVLVSSNQKHEYEFCTESLHIPDFK